MINSDQLSNVIISFRGVFLVVLIFSASYLTPYMGCNVQNLLKMNSPMKHLLLFLLIYFTINLVSPLDKNISNPVVELIKSVGVYFVFLLLNILDSYSIIDHNYFWSVLSEPNKNLLPKGINIIILEINENNTIDLLCPKNIYQRNIFDEKRDSWILLKQNQFLEHANVFGCHYGTLKNEVVSKIIKGTDVIVDIDWQGTRQIANHLPKDIVKVFILPPSMRELENRLGKRASENKENFKKRMSEAKKEISHYTEYDFVIVNNDLQLAVDQIKLILFSERLRRYRQLNLDKTIEKLI